MSTVIPSSIPRAHIDLAAHLHVPDASTTTARTQQC
jgi:hypothetical protein